MSQRRFSLDDFGTAEPSSTDLRSPRGPKPREVAASPRSALIDTECAGADARRSSGFLEVGAFTGADRQIADARLTRET
jgi:hypothetical protein